MRNREKKANEKQKHAEREREKLRAKKIWAT